MHTNPNSDSPRIANVISMTNIRGVSMYDWAISNILPNPLVAPTNSPITAPITLEVIAIFNAAKIYGSAMGKRTLNNTWSFEAEIEFIKSSRHGSTDLKPTIVLIKSGKNVIKIMIATFDHIPNPNHMVKRGAMAMMGITFIKIANG
jgi:hypothetical protein